MSVEQVLACAGGHVRIVIDEMPDTVSAQRLLNFVEGDGGNPVGDPITLAQGESGKNLILEVRGQVSQSQRWHEGQTLENTVVGLAVSKCKGCNGESCDKPCTLGLRDARDLIRAYLTPKNF